MNAILMISALTILLTILLGSHFFVYFSLIRFLGIVVGSTKIWMASTLLFLAVSFIGASVLAHYNENYISRIFYLASGIWLGVGWNLVLAFIVAWAIVAITKSIGVQIEYKYLVVASVIFTISFSSYGVWNAYHPKIKNITVKIKNLPEQWKGKKAIQLSDVHLGHVYGKNFLENLIEQVNMEKPDIVFITGDLFDGMDGQLDSLVSPFNDIDAPSGTYFVTGNHETYLGVSKSLNTLQKTSIKILNNEVINVDGMQILGISYPERGEKSKLAEAIKQIDNFNVEKPNILLYHSPAEVKKSRESGINFQLSGHTHVGQLFPFQLITQLVYGKYHYGLSQEGDFSIYTSSGIGTWGPAMRTNSRPEIVVISFE